MKVEIDDSEVKGGKEVHTIRIKIGDNIEYLIEHENSKKIRFIVVRGSGNLFIESEVKSILMGVKR